MSLFTSLVKKMWATAPRRTISISFLSTLTAFLATTIYTEFFRSVEKKAVFEETLLNQPLFRSHMGANFEEKFGVNIAMFFMLVGTVWGLGEFTRVKLKVYQEERRQLQKQRRQSESLQSVLLPKREVSVDGQGEAKQHYNAIMGVLQNTRDFATDQCLEHLEQLYWKTVFWPAWQFLQQMPSDITFTGSLKKLRDKLNEEKLKAYYDKMRTSDYHKLIMPQEKIAEEIQNGIVDFRGALAGARICGTQADLQTMADSMQSWVLVAGVTPPDCAMQATEIWNDHLKELYHVYYDQWDALLKGYRIDSSDLIPDLQNQRALLVEMIQKLKPFIDSVKEGGAFKILSSQPALRNQPLEPQPVSPVVAAGVLSRGSSESGDEAGPSSPKSPGSARSTSSDKHRPPSLMLG